MGDRKTIYVPNHVDDLVHELSEDGESYSDTVTRLVEAGARAERGETPTGYVAVGEGPGDLGRLAERYLRDEAGN